ncbi:Asp23/Gls24 family envelope stress response protein [Streptomyces sp. NPDC006923]|uniref:Asp23/Gls24 family envelope stress response protein n=1 Tax=Streptomyces sp. NPDC006923 TaxID=3155355 RepID=UPI003406A043
MTPHEIQDELARVAADAARLTPGVAFLRPGLVDLLRASAASRTGRPRTWPAGRAGRTPGVHVRQTAGPAWHIDVQLVARAAYRTVDVTRAIREAVEAATAGVLSGSDHQARTTVTVTVTGII